MSTAGHSPPPSPPKVSTSIGPALLAFSGFPRYSPELLNILITEVMNLRLKEDDIKRVLDFMQRQLLQEQGISHDLKYHTDDLNNHKKSSEREMLQYLDLLQNFEGTKNEKRYKSHQYEKGHDIHKKVHIRPTSVVLFKPKDNNEFKSTFLPKFLNEIVGYWKQRPEKYVNSQTYFHKSKQPKSNKINFNSELQKLKNFSKFYLILNTSPSKRIVNEDLKQVSTLLSSILSSKPTESQRDRKKYYKGFAIKDELLSSLRRRDSDEHFSRKYSAEDDYRPKQSRSRYGDSVGGRTAIPFTGKHRDVYEDY